MVDLLVPVLNDVVKDVVVNLDVVLLVLYDVVNVVVVDLLVPVANDVL